MRLMLLALLAVAACDVGQVTVPSTGTPNGNPDPGLDCQSAGCHVAGGTGPTWTVSGTLYNAATGGAALAGATITIVDANGATHDLVTSLNGNFWTADAIPLPAKTFASKCPAI